MSGQQWPALMPEPGSIEFAEVVDKYEVTLLLQQRKVPRYQPFHFKKLGIPIEICGRLFRHIKKHALHHAH